MSGANRIGGNRPHPHVTHSQPNTQKKNEATQKTTSQKTQPQQIQSTQTRNEKASELVATKQGIDLSSLRRANLNAQFAVSASAKRSAGASRARGLDEYSHKLPTPGQPRNNPDRNRLVNRTKLTPDGLFPARLKREGVKQGLNLFSKEGASRGEIKNDSRFDLDFSRKRRINGKTYVLARGVELKNGKVTTGYVQQSSKYVNYSSAFNFSVRDGLPRPQLYDGQLRPLGPTSDTVKTVKINFGQRMEVNNEVYYLAYDTRLQNGKAVSSWIKESDLNLSAAETRLLRSMPSVTARKPPQGADYTAYKIGGSNPNREITIKRGDQTVRIRFGELSFTPKKGSGVGSMQAKDYMTRDTGTVNLLYSLPGGDGGVSTSTFLADSNTTFYRWNNKQPPSRDITLYDPKTGKVALDARGNKITMKFVYGYADTPAGRREGWMAYDNLHL